MDNGLLNAGMEESKDLAALADGSTGLWKDDQVVYRDEILTGYTDFKGKLDAELKANAEGFVRIGYLLKVARDTNILAESGYKNVAEFAFAEYHLTKDIVSRYIAINDKYAENGYSDKLQTKFEGFGVAKLQEMLTLPDAIIEEIEPTLTKREIIDIKREVAAEEAITPIEMAIEAAAPEVQKEEKELTLAQRVWKDIIKSLWDKYNVKDKNSALNRIITTEYPFVTDESFTKPLELALYELIAPSGTATLWARIPGVGRYMVTVKGLDEPINMVNARDGSKINTSFADAVRDIADIFDGECTPKSWERVYGLANPQYEETETKAPDPDKKIPNNTEKAPENTENAQKDAENAQNLPENAQNHLEKDREYEEKEKVAPVQQAAEVVMPKPGSWTYDQSETKSVQPELENQPEAKSVQPEVNKTQGDNDDEKECSKEAADNRSESDEDRKVPEGAEGSGDYADNDRDREKALGKIEVGDRIVNLKDGTKGTMIGHCAGEYKISTENGLILVNENTTTWKKEEIADAEYREAGKGKTENDRSGESTGENDGSGREQDSSGERGSFGNIDSEITVAPDETGKTGEAYESLADAEDIKDKVRDLRLKAKSINENLGEWLIDGIWNRFGSLCDEVIKAAEEIADTLRVLKDNAREFMDGDD